MQGILNIFQGIVNSNYPDLNILLKSLANHQSFRYNRSNSSVAQSITSSLSQSSTRYAGLLILSEFLKQGTLEIIEQKAALWTTLCIKACNPREQSSCTSLAYDVLSQIIQKSVDIPDLAKAFSSHLLIKIFETLNNITVASYFSALKMIEKCLKLYSGPCSQFRVQIEKFIYSLVDSRDEKVVKLCGKCLHLLQQVRGSGMHGVSCKSTWQTYQLRLLGSLHEILGKIYSNCSEVYDEGIEMERLQINPLELSNEPISRSLQLFTRFKNLMIYLEIAIKEPFSVSKCIMPKKILNLISRVFAINCKILEKNSVSDNLAIGAILPEMHIECFKLINTMILILQSHLAMYYKTILNFVMETLKWTSFGKTIGFCKPYNSLRIAAYRTLSLWCETMKNGSECQLIEDMLIEQIIFDITPFQNELTLKVLSGTKKHMSKKARRLLHKAQNEQTHLIQAHSRSVDPQITKKEFSDEGNENVCIVSLSCLKCVLISSSHCLKPISIKKIQDKILELCLQLSRKINQNDKSLYAVSNCRRQLYCVLYSFVISSHHLCPLPVPLIVTLINRAQLNDNCKLVKEDCNLFMRNLETIIHPYKDNLNFPNDLNEIKKALITNQANNFPHYNDVNETENSIRIIISDHDEDNYDREKEVDDGDNYDREKEVGDGDNYDRGKEVGDGDNYDREKGIDATDNVQEFTDDNNEYILDEIGDDEETRNIFDQQKEVEAVKMTQSDDKKSDKELRELKRSEFVSFEIVVDAEMNEGNHSEHAYDEPFKKKMRFEQSEDEKSIEKVSKVDFSDKCNDKITQNEKCSTVDKGSEEIDNDNLVDEIASTFINELNEDSD